MTTGLVTALLLQAATLDPNNQNLARFVEEATPDTKGISASAEISLVDENVDIRLNEIELIGPSEKDYSGTIKGYSICLAYQTKDSWNITKCTPMRSRPAKLKTGSSVVLAGSTERISYQGLPPISAFWLVIDVTFARRGKPNESHYFVSSQQDVFKRIATMPATSSAR